MTDGKYTYTPPDRTDSMYRCLPAGGECFCNSDKMKSVPATGFHKKKKAAEGTVRAAFRYDGK